MPVYWASQGKADKGTGFQIQSVCSPPSRAELEVGVEHTVFGARGVQVPSCPAPLRLENSAGPLRRKNVSLLRTFQTKGLMNMASGCFTGQVTLEGY